jgi:hypothetical protein
MRFHDSMGTSGNINLEADIVAVRLAIQEGAKAVPAHDPDEDSDFDISIIILYI